MIHIITNEQRRFTVVFLEPSANKPVPSDLIGLQFPEVNPEKGLVLGVQLSPSHRWFGWVLGVALAHYQDLSMLIGFSEERDAIAATAPRWIGIYDASLCGAVVVHSHLVNYPPGRIVKVIYRDAITGAKVRKGAAVPYSTQNISSAPHRQGARKRKIAYF